MIESKDKVIPKRYTQVAVASFGPTKRTDCGKKPSGFTRMTSYVLEWVMHTTEMRFDGGKAKKLFWSYLYVYLTDCRHEVLRFW